MEETVVCPSCKQQVSKEHYFCPNCGKKLRDKPLSTSVLAQFGVYAFSILLPPFGIWPAIKYLRQQDTASKIVGIVVILLTVVSLGVTAYFSTAAVQYANNIMKYETSTPDLKNFGY